MKYLKTLSLTMVLGLGACGGANLGDGANGNKDAGDGQVVTSSLVVKDGDDVVAYFLSAAPYTGQSSSSLAWTLMTPLGKIHRVNPWTGDHAVTSSGGPTIYFEGASCTGTAYASYLESGAYPGTQFLAADDEYYESQSFTAYSGITAGFATKSDSSGCAAAGAAPAADSKFVQVNEMSSAPADYSAFAPLELIAE